MLFFTRVGKYTEEEFESAFKQFRETNKPFIFTYFKDAPISSAAINDDMISLLQFKKKLSALGHFYSTYKSIEELTAKFNSQLQKLEDEHFLKLRVDNATPKPPEIKINQTHSGTGDNVGGNKIVNN